jgi:uncharacterized protein (TIGR00299 family) protein
LREIQRLIEQSTLSDRTKARSLEVIGRLGRVEAGIHGVPLGEVHFHEIGAVDTIIDVVGFVAGLELLGVEEVYASAIPLGNGTIETAHGRLPAPAPATLALLASVGAPTVPHPAQTEIVTPTGAALLSGLALFERPAMRVRAVGYGLGQKEFAWVNGLRLWIGDRPAGPGWAHGRATVQAGLGAHSRATVLADAGGAEDRFGQDEVVVIECNLDDSTGEVLGYTMERLFGAGALDVWFTAIQMKKDRPGVLLAALAPWDKVDALCSVLLHETSTLGVRFSAPAQRLKAGRRLRQVMTPWGEVQVKEKWLGADRANRSSAADKVVPGECISVSPEYEDCARLARAAGVPLMRVMDAARRAAACPDTGEQIGAHDRAPVPAGDEGAGARACDE